MSDNNSKEEGMSFCGLLTIAFIVLKLCNVIAWSWWWVLSPLWIPVSLFIIGLIIYILFITIKEIPKNNRGKHKIIIGGRIWERNKNTDTSISHKSKFAQRIEEMQKRKQG